MDLRREYPAGRAARRDGRGDHHPPVPIGQVDGLDDAVIGQVEDRARSIPLRTSILVHRLVVLWNVDVLTTPITAGPRAVLRQRRDAPHHHEPGRAGIRMTGLHVWPVSTGYSMTSPPGRSSGLRCSTGSLEPRTSWASTGRYGTGSLRGYQPSEVVDSESWMIWTWRR